MSSDDTTSPNTIDEYKGRVKQAAADLKGDDDLRTEGKIDRFVSDVKDKVDHVADSVKDLFTDDERAS